MPVGLPLPPLFTHINIQRIDLGQRIRLCLAERISQALGIRFGYRNRIDIGQRFDHAVGERARGTVHFGNAFTVCSRLPSTAPSVTPEPSETTTSSAAPSQFSVVTPAAPKATPSPKPAGKLARTGADLSGTAVLALILAIGGAVLLSARSLRGSK